MDYTFKDGLLYLHRTPEERAPITARLRRIEGQVGGIRQMLEQDRYCGDEVQQASAVIAAMREVAVMIIGQHLEAEMQAAVDQVDRKALLDEMMTLLRTAMKL